ncbi:hypothetical protein [Mesonia aestuariivivens]|uniref:Uncharacterized protein n=1 Tax=Mesonia aestuariivivens TaxID=2796128 RepID=A0ABS6VYJ2_9FLAO|nr:hypothetical protein [Mesonia aestuariivivens]MBW2960574.1 hypothetical protein [Mesonia aestuariivivens]
MKNSHSYLVPTTIKLKKELAALVCNMDSCWSKLLVEKELGNHAPSIWQIKLAAEEVEVNKMNKTFQFKNAKFSFDVNLEEPHETGMNYITTLLVSGEGSFVYDKEIEELKILDLVLDEC